MIPEDEAVILKGFSDEKEVTALRKIGMKIATYIVRDS